MTSCAFCLRIQAIVVFFLICCISATPTQNITIEVPDGTSSHGDPHILCTPATALSILTFFFGNFLTHAATVKVYPGEESIETALSVINAVLFPTSGIIRGLSAFARRSVFTSGSLQRAARSGALCMVIRDRDWKPQDGTEIAGFEITPESALVDDSSNNDIFHIDGESYAFKSHSLSSAVRRLLRWSPIFPLAQQVGHELIRDYAHGISYYPATFKASPPLWIKRLYDSRIIGTFCTKPRQRYIFYEGDADLGTDVVLKTYIPPWLTESSMWWLYRDTYDTYITSRAVHGYHHLPSGYSLAFVPRNAKVENLPDSGEPNLDSSYNYPKLTIALFQTIYASFTLFQSRGDQIGRYGYAAFGLTVLPYVVMSCVNLIGNMITPDYPQLYMVESEVMLEARGCGARFRGVVGQLVRSSRVDTEQHRGTFRTKTTLRARRGATNGQVPGMISSGESGLASIMEETTSHVGREGATNGPVPDMNSSGEGGLTFTTGETTLGVWRKGAFPNLWIPACPPFERSDSSSIHEGHTLFMELLETPTFIVGVVVVLINGIVLGVLGGLTGGFNAEGSTHAQRIWIMIWLTFGFFIGIVVTWMPAIDVMTISGRLATLMPKKFDYYMNKLAPVMVSITYCAPAVGGLVVVGRMLRDYGSCQYFG